MTDVVFATVDAGGNVPPMRDIAVEVARRGHRVRVLGHEQQRTSFERAGLEFHAYSDPEPWDPTELKSTFDGLRGFIRQLTARDKGDDLIALTTPDSVVVVDCMLVAVLGAAQDAGHPTVALVHAFHAYFDGPWRRGPLGMAARLKGLGPRRLWKNCDAVLVCTDRELDPAGSRDWPDTFVWTGPVQPETRSAVPVAPRRVLASLSTIAFPGQQEAVQNILDGLADTAVDVVLTTGPAVDSASLTVPANAEVHAFLPHDEVMAGCSAVIGHGGHSTTVRALAHGLPLVIMPMHPMLDQPMVGKAVEAIGAGVSIKRTASPEQIRTAIETVLDGPHRAAAEAIAERWRGADGTVVAADRILALQPKPVSP
ncbi:glycosyltransferase [Aeromicrobium sp.]|uniref:glycosyltransferase n=1 Tax=Aeromicrobium sp. TaxID=1871063 RepID=UPI003C67E53E